MHRRRLLGLALVSIGFGLLWAIAVQGADFGVWHFLTVMHILFPSLAFFAVGAGIFSWLGLRRLMRERPPPTN